MCAVYLRVWIKDISALYEAGSISILDFLRMEAAGAGYGALFGTGNRVRPFGSAVICADRLGKKKSPPSRGLCCIYIRYGLLKLIRTS